MPEHGPPRRRLAPALALGPATVGMPLRPSLDSVRAGERVRVGPGVQAVRVQLAAAAAQGLGGLRLEPGWVPCCLTSCHPASLAPSCISGN